MGCDRAAVEVEWRGMEATAPPAGKGPAATAMRGRAAITQVGRGACSVASAMPPEANGN